MGLVDIHNRPYEKLVTMLAKLDLPRVHSLTYPPRGDTTHGVPAAPSNPIGQWTQREALREWDRERGFVPANSSGPFADLYLGWNQHQLWLGVYVMDMTGKDYYRDRKVPEMDQMHWRITLQGANQEFAVRLGVGSPAMRMERQSLHSAGFQTLAYHTRAIAVLRVPASALDKKSFKPGDVIELVSTLDSQARAERTNWNGSFTLK